MSRKGGGAKKCSINPRTCPVERMCRLPRHAGCGPGGTPPFPVKNRCFVRKLLLRENIFSRHEKLFSRHDKIFSRHGIFLGNIRVLWRWDCVAWKSIPVAQRTTAEMLGAVGRAANEIKKAASTRGGGGAALMSYCRKDGVKSRLLAEALA